MPTATFTGLVNNAALLLALGVLYDVLPREQPAVKAWMHQVLGGIVLAVMGVAVMLTPWDFGGGIVLDTRSILLCLAGLFFGLVPTLVVMAATVIYRLYLGGGGMWTGTAIILASAGIGLAWRAWRHKGQPNNIAPSELYLLGVTVHAVMLLLMFTLPNRSGLAVLARISLPVMIIYPAVTALLGMLLTNWQARQRLAEDLRHSETLNRAIMDNLPVGIAVNSVSPVVTFQYMNDNFCKFYRTPREALANPDTFWQAAYTDPAFREQIKARVLEDVASGDPQRMFWQDIPLAREGQETTYITARNVPLPDRRLLISTVWDVSERKRAEEERAKLTEQLQLARRLESVGLLAGGVAHDLNNMLTPILGYSELLRDDLAPGDPLRADVDEIIAAADRARALIRQLLAFARRQTLEMQPLNLNQLVEGLITLLRRTLREDIVVETHLNADLGPVVGDHGQIEQVIMNLTVNAQDAMPKGGTLLIETAEVTLDENYAATHPEVKVGLYAMLAMSDTGMGMDKQTLTRLFEPFFSTKEVGKGTGLGLATVYGIVKQHGGSISVYSEPGHGSTFKVYLPRTDLCVETLTPATEQQPARGTETVLVAEDNEQVLALSCELLRRSGYTVLEASDGQAACSLSASYSGEIHLLLTDVVMPDMNGKMLHAHLVATRPDLRVLYMSGYTANVIAHHGELEQGILFVPKPFQPQHLLAKVRQALDTQ